VAVFSTIAILSNKHFARNFNNMTTAPFVTKNFMTDAEFV